MTAVASVKIEYNDPTFDREHHPITEGVRNAVAKIHAQFGLPDGQSWWYHATAHGVIVFFNYEKKKSRLYNRLGVDNLRFLAELPGFRWIESNDGKVSIGLEFKTP